MIFFLSEYFGCYFFSKNGIKSLSFQKKKKKKKHNVGPPVTKFSGSMHAEHSISKFHIVLSFQSAYLPEKISELPLICITNFGKRLLRSISRRHDANFVSQKNINVSRMNSIK